MPHAHILLLAPVEMAKLLSRSDLDSPFEREHFTLPYLPFLHPLHSLTYHSLSTKAPPVLSSSLLGCWKGPPPPTTPSRAVNTRSLCRSGPGFMELTHTRMNTGPPTTLAPLPVFTDQPVQTPLGHCHCADGAGGGPRRQEVEVPGSSEALETWPWVFLGSRLRLFTRVWFA